MTEASFKCLEATGNYTIRDRGMIPVKGKVIMHTYFLEGTTEDIDDYGITHLVKEKRKSLLRTFAEGEEEDHLPELMGEHGAKEKKKRSRFMSMARHGSRHV